MTAEGVGPLLREWRHRRSMSQMALAHATHVSPRHLSFVETGRSRPSAELVVALAIRLDVPLRERNRMLLAAGFAPRYDETPLDAAAMDRVWLAVQRLLDAHDPYPGMVLDRRHDIVAVNGSAERFLATLPETLRETPVNLFRACLHPDGFGGDSPNFAHWAPIMLGQLRRLAATTDDADLVELRDEIETWDSMSVLDSGAGPSAGEARGELLVSSTFVIGGVELSLFSTLTSFGSPRDITLDDLSIELFFPADDHTDAALRHLCI
ncbi:MAG: helix-turn-helix domain-containing protein [Desertimonas sp.]